MSIAFKSRVPHSDFQEWADRLSPDVRDWVHNVFTAEVLSDGAMSIACVLADHMDDALMATVPMNVLRFRTPVESENDARVALDELVTAGYLERYRRPGHTNVYAAMRWSRIEDEFTAWLRENGGAA
jgi:hypothetical protein